MFLKLSTTILLLLAFYTKSICQSITINNVDKPDFRNTGAIMEGKTVKGYYVLYQTKEENGGYVLQFTDANLQKINEVHFPASTKLWLLESAYNNKQFAFHFYDDDKKEMIIKVFEENGKLAHEYSRPIKKDKKAFDKKQAIPQSLFSLDKAGFISLIPIWINNRQTYAIDYYSGTAKTWNYIPNDREQIVQADFFGYADSIIILQVQKKIDLNYSNFSSYIIGLNIKNGSLAFETPVDNKDYFFVPIMFAQKANSTNLLFIGTYYRQDKFAEYGQGMAIMEIDAKGNLLSQAYNSWAEDFSKYVAVNKQGKIADLGYMYIHNVVQTNDGKMFVIAEGYKRKASAVGIGIAAVTASVAQSVPVGLTKISTTNMSIIKFSKEHRVVDFETFEKKEKSRQMLLDNHTVHQMAMAFASKGFFDYDFTTQENNAESFTVYYNNYEKLDGYKGNTINSLYYKGGDFTIVKSKLDSHAEDFKVLPAATNKIALVEYLEKENTIQLSIKPMQ